MDVSICLIGDKTGEFANKQSELAKAAAALHKLADALVAGKIVPVNSFTPGAADTTSFFIYVIGDNGQKWGVHGFIRSPATNDDILGDKK